MAKKHGSPHLKLAIASIACVLLATGCSRDVSKAVSAVNNAAEAVVKASDKLALAVPGERWQRIVDAATKGNREDKAAALKQIERLFGVDLSSTYEISVWYGLNPDSVLHSAVTVSAIPSADGIRQYCGISYEPAQVANSMGRPQTEEEIRKVVREHIAAAIQEVMPVAIYSQNGIVSEVTGVMAGNESKAVDHFVSALTAQYAAIVVPTATQTIRRPYAPFEGDRWLLILVNEEDLAAATKGREKEPIARALAHKTGDPNSAFANNWTVEFTKAEFLARDSIECGVLKTKVRWVAHDMTNAPIINQTFLDSLEQLHRDVDKMNKAFAESEKN